MRLYSKALLLSVTAGIASVGMMPKMACSLNIDSAPTQDEVVKRPISQKRSNNSYRDVVNQPQEPMCKSALHLPDDDTVAAKHTLDDHEWVRNHEQLVKKYNIDYEHLFALSKKLVCLSPHWEKGLIYASDGSRAHIPWSWVR